LLGRRGVLGSSGSASDISVSSLFGLFEFRVMKNRTTLPTIRIRPRARPSQSASQDTDLDDPASRQIEKAEEQRGESVPGRFPRGMITWPVPAAI
jgi:hypothetical protein